MDNIQRKSEGPQDFKTFARNYFQYIARLMEGLDLDKTEQFLKELEEARKRGNTVFIIGNGGSAATASHLVNDLGFGVCRSGRGFKVVTLTDNVSVLTALSNDTSYEHIFLKQIQLYFHQDDKLLVISASGNSPNLVTAAQWVKDNGGRVLGFLGFDGGKLKSLCDVAVLVQTPQGEYGPVEDIHMILNHLLSSWFKERFKA